MGNQKPKLGVVSEDGKIIWKTGNKISWWKKVSILQIFQIPLGIAIIIAVILGMIFNAAEVWHAATTAWTTAFFLMVLFWQLEFQMRKDSELRRADNQSGE